jgi:transcriptional regulator of acetoin/glycerol metabolism
VDIAVIAATHRNLREMIERHCFREDLYYRLNGLALRLPPLRERSDLEAVARRILQSLRQPDVPELGRPVLELFRHYPWPGNIRQLANVLRTAAALSVGERQITTAHLSDDFFDDARRCAAAAAALPAVARAGLAPPAHADFDVPPRPAPSLAGAPTEVPAPARAPTEAPPPPPPPPLQAAPVPAAPEALSGRTLEEAETEMIRATLQALGGNISAASKRLGISRNTIYRKLRWNRQAASER